MGKVDKERYWTFIMYPDSRPENWKEILQETGLRFAISPLHDKDINPTGEQKKPHYHVLVIFEGPTTYNRVCQITESINASIPKRVMSTIGLIRYFTHEDNPEKAQYNKEDITTINGLDIKEINGITSTEKERIKRAIIEMININEFVEYKQIIDYLIQQQLYEYMEICSNNTIFFTAYMNSTRYSRKEKQKDLKTNYNYDI